MKPIFVFGSNLAGIHGAGAARDALNFHGAIMGIGDGMQGNSYGIPTKDENIQTLPIEEVRYGVNRFIAYAKANPSMVFHITAIGCGLAGFSREDIKPMFKNAPKNCFFFEQAFGRPIPMEYQQTHWETCWQDPKHHACALREIKRLQEFSESQEEALRAFESGAL